ncbi:MULTISPECIES: glycosyltransferase family 4 protein [Gordonia]|uniref:Glycosyltransferase family 4 protein n=1 Tax=Gordonia amicalis TaxID=89053 RepID=A0AAE4R0U8_9ACTN|nr:MULTISPECIES: glycosyltransferase family 4 protein [Gordonia]ATD71939.1 glycosyltransferase family 1 protein [Gordonia sp. 1D]MCZ4650736.1 glycosyltransferase family 4 protein [Gordonia amicalis]MDJ0451664.1 glycosyltransferase family 4 protein [Gordonia amicalis]MDV6306514.1 glycosyltransferase family 4 protein [Gordonia amicalis]MDV6311243.1 glycosyltransferase family 4 protein [Gordonia amicalis]
MTEPVMSTGTLVFVAHTGQVSGAEKVMLDLIDVALERGRRVVVVCPDGPLPDRLPDGVQHVPIPPLGLSGERGLRRLAGASRLLVDWVRAGRILRRITRHNATTIVNSLFALPAARVASPPGRASWLVHDTLSSGRQRAVVRLSAPAIRRAVAVSEATAAPLTAMGLPTVVAHNGVRWPVPALSTEVHDPPVVGILALLTPWKGHAVLLEAVASLPGVELEFAGGSFPGDADHVAFLHERAGRPDLAGRVRFLGHTDTEDALERWDVVVSASVTPEAGPLSVLEAMAYGKPVIGTDHGGTTEFLRGGAGILVPPSDAPALAAAITRVLDDADLRRAMTAQARDRIGTKHDKSVTLPLMLHELSS